MNYMKKNKTFTCLRKLIVENNNLLPVCIVMFEVTVRGRSFNFLTKKFKSYYFFSRHQEAVIILQILPIFPVEKCRVRILML